MNNAQFWKKRRLRPIAKAATAHYFENSGHAEQVEQHGNLDRPENSQTHKQLDHPENSRIIEKHHCFSIPPQVLREVSISQRHHVQNV